jgi:serine/threonine protein kinase
LSKDSFPNIQERARFAIPFGLYPPDQENSGILSVLAAYFLSEECYSLSGEPEHRQLDLWQLLHDNNEFDENQNELFIREIQRHISRTISLVKKVHLGGDITYQNKRTPDKLYSEAYKWYLFLEDDSIHTTLLGHLTEPTIKMFGEQWPNPVFYIGKILPKRHNPAIGIVHGDLHPKNITISNNEVNIIDFGWFNKAAPVVLDYVLLDINIRAMTLPSRFSYEEIKKTASYLHPDSIMEEAVSPLISKRMNIIKNCLWTPLLENRAFNKKEWDAEYLVPYFIVAYRLLSFHRSARNQTALLLTVLVVCRLLHEKGIFDEP